MIPYYLYLYRGDIRTASRNLANIMHYLHYVNERRMHDEPADGIVRFGLGDWLPPYGSAEEHRCPVGLTSTAFFYRCLILVAGLARAAGRAADADWCRREAASVWEAFHEKYYNEATGGFGPEDITSLAVPIHFGLATGDRLPRVADRLAQVVKAEEFHFQCGVVGASSVLHALSQTGRTDLAWRMLTADGFPGYMDWLDRGATTLWEDWHGNASLNHVFLADAVAWMYGHIAGLPLRPARTASGPSFTFNPWPPADRCKLRVRSPK